MKKMAILFLLAVLILIGILAFVLLIWFPQIEGRATNLNVYEIYFDKFIIYVYASSIAFFEAIYNAYKLLSLICQNKIYTPNALKYLRNIKYCTVLLSILIVVAGIFILTNHSTEDDPAGFLMLCFISTLVCVGLAYFITIFERKLQKAIRFDT